MTEDKYIALIEKLFEKIAALEQHITNNYKRIQAIQKKIKK